MVQHELDHLNGTLLVDKTKPEDLMCQDLEMKPAHGISGFHQTIEGDISQASIVFQFHNIYTAVSEERI